jgi:two-component sensor histidine kinase
MALIHESLCQSPDLNRIKFGEYLSKLAGGFFAPDSTMIASIQPIVEGHLLPIEMALPCGLIVNQLLTNAVKHAFPNGAGNVWVEFSLENDHLLLSVRDDGVGLPCDVDVERARTLGLRLVQSLVGQINGRMHVSRTDEGTTFMIHFAQPPGLTA